MLVLVLTFSSPPPPPPPTTAAHLASSGDKEGHNRTWPRHKINKRSTVTCYSVKA
ncbi:conserved hypothetical protein [Ricinus communis]|uniref:Uncharacterized protein n=1 Tax=Ricinus communis TaxID=3988 RepID=B9T3J9_RICCO|nr:conserved hypothetical protein [Ricinus communis]